MINPENHNIEIRRHADKNEQGSLSEAGRERAREFAGELLREIENAPLGSVFAVVPSNLPRAQETRHEIELMLQDALSNRFDIEIVPVLDKDKITKLANDKRYIISELAWSSLLGYRQEGQEKEANDYFDSVVSKLEGDKLFAFKFWVAWKEELDHLKQTTKDAHPQVHQDVIDSLRPENFKFPPEEYAIKAYGWLKRMREIMQSRFSDRHCKVLGISHDDVSDFLTYSLLGHRISAETIEHFGSMRAFLEPSQYQFRPDGGVTVSFRDETKELAPQDLLEFEKRVEKEKDSRLEEWRSI